MYFTGNPVEFAEWIKERLGENEYEALRIRAHKVKTKVDKESLYLYFKQKLKELEER